MATRKPTRFWFMKLFDDLLLLLLLVVFLLLQPPPGCGWPLICISLWPIHWSIRCPCKERRRQIGRSGPHGARWGPRTTERAARRRPWVAGQRRHFFFSVCVCVCVCVCVLVFSLPFSFLFGLLLLRFFRVGPPAAPDASVRPVDLPSTLLHSNDRRISFSKQLRWSQKVPFTFTSDQVGSAIDWQKGDFVHFPFLRNFTISRHRHFVDFNGDERGFKDILAYYLAFLFLELNATDLSEELN